MTGTHRRAIIGLVMSVTIVIAFLVTLPIAQRYSQTKLQTIAANHKNRPPGGNIAVAAVYPTIGAVVASLVLGMIEGVIAGRLLRLRGRNRSAGANVERK